MSGKLMAIAAETEVEAPERLPQPEPETFLDLSR